MLLRQLLPTGTLLSLIFSGIYLIILFSVYMWARPQPKGASICNTDGVGPVANAAWADDLLFVSGAYILLVFPQTLGFLYERHCSFVVFLKAQAQVYCFSGGNNSGTKTLNAGVNEFTAPLAAGGVGCSVTRNGVKLIDYKPTDFTYSTSPSVCNVSVSYCHIILQNLLTYLRLR